MTRCVFLSMCLLLSGCAGMHSSARVRTQLPHEYSFCKNDTATVNITSTKGGDMPEEFPERIKDIIRQTIDLKKYAVECANNTSRNFIVEGNIIKVVDHTKHAFSNTAGYGSLEIIGDFKVKIADTIIADFRVDKEHFWSTTANQNGSMFLHEFEPFFADEVADFLISQKK